MPAGNKVKTNAIRMLDAMKIPYKEHTYRDDVPLSGTEVAALLNEDPSRVFKTLVTTGKSGTHYVFMVPVNAELDLKKAAAAVGEKSVEMLRAAELFPLTGYIHGGCSPVGMKKRFRTVIDESAESAGRIFCSGGRLGCQIEIELSDLRRALPVESAPIAKR
jgi:Cys-tRNA(Pro)/Cys-tRNA(Cys) deacylase